MRDALMIALQREAQDANGQPTRKLNLIAEKLIEKAIDGDIQAIKEINDRVDGKAPQAIIGDSENPLSFAFAGLKDDLVKRAAQIVEQPEPPSVHSEPD